MIEDQKIEKMKLIGTLRLSHFFFSKRTKYVWAYSLLIPGMCVIRVFMSIWERKFQDCLSSRLVDESTGIPRFSIAPAEMMIFMFTKVYYWSIEFVIKMVFEFLITPIGGVMVQFLLHRMLMAENPKIFEISPSSCEYTMTEGSKALAKIVRLIFIGFISTLLQIFEGFFYVYTRMSSENKKKTYIIFIGYIILAVMKLLHLNRVFYLIYEASHTNSQKEKLYVEAVDSLHIVKTSREEHKVISRYQRALNAWESIMTKAKLQEYSNTFLFTLGFDMMSAFTMILFISGIANNSQRNGGVQANFGLINNYYKAISKIPNLMNTMIKFYKEITESMVLSQNLIEYMQFTVKKLQEKISKDSFNNSIKVQHLIYSTKDKLIFSGVNFTINKGDRIALFGRNGSGKSSIFKLILGFDEFKGSITIDDIDISRLSMPEYRSLITYVPQDTKLFDDSIFYNLTFGNDKSYKEVVEECKKMQIHDTIMTFPNGYNTMVGEGGKILNGGLRQKIFYTRAFLCDSEIYMFDEPTNNLDLKHSQFLLEYMNDPKYDGKTFFVICHDLSIVRKFPRIFHFEEGKIKAVETI